MWQWLLSLGTGLNPDNPKSLVHDWPGHVHGIFKCYGVGQAPFMWQLRTDPRILDIFSALWRTPAEDLLCSFDGCSIMKPRRYWRCKTSLEGRLHVDVHPERDAERRADLAAKNLIGSPCIQGLVRLSDMDPSTGTFACIPGSHKNFRNHSPRKRDWYILSTRDLAELGEPVRISAPAGTLVLWDSRTAHCGAKPLRADDARFRHVCYVSYMPRFFASTRELAKRQEAFETGRTSSHWAYPVSLNARRVRYDTKKYTIDIPPIEAYLGEENVALAKRLIGYDA